LAITQEASAEKALAALASLNSPIAKVIRGGETLEVDVKDVVPGDIIILETGSSVPADARLLEIFDLTVDEAALTGESEPVEKILELELTGKIPLGDQKNMVFSGCLVTAGRGKAVVVATGMQTEMGKIAGYLNDVQKLKTPLQIRLNKVSRTISLMAVASVIMLLIIGFLQGIAAWDIVFLAVSLGVAAVPEMLNLIVTLTLAHGVKQMVQKNAVVRKLPAVETLGSTSVICTDKTGTLTQNRMAIKKLWLACNIDTTGDDDNFSNRELEFIEHLALSSNAITKFDEDGKRLFLGNPTEAAILRLLYKKGMNMEDLEAKYPRIHEIPFSSSRKMMTTVHEMEDGKYLVLTKGAFDRLPFSGETEAEIEKRNKVHDDFAHDALRVIALGSRIVDNITENLEELEKDLTFIGIIGLIDPPRPECFGAIERAKKAGIRTVMITGDHAATAGAIAKQLGIMTEGGRVMTGVELEELSSEELVDIVPLQSVYARVSPEDKIRIVEAWQEHSQVVAMTGDGVNDAPALKAADVGVAMGITGTEVAKSASDMTLADDNFATIVDAVHEGRNVFAIIRKVVYFLLVCNISEIIIIIGGVLFGWGAVITPIMLLLINVVGDGIPGLRLAQEVAGKKIMERPPIGREESFFGDGLVYLIAKQVIAFTIVTWIAYYIGAFTNFSANVAPSHEVGQTTAFMVIGFTSILHILTARTKMSVFKKRTFTNNPLLAISAFAMVALFVLFVIVPPFNVLFDTVPIGIEHWGMIAVLSVIPTFVAEIGKAYSRSKERREHKNRIIKHSMKED